MTTGFAFDKNQEHVLYLNNEVFLAEDIRYVK